MYGNIYDDTLINYGTNAKIKGDAGNDIIKNWGNGNVVIDGGADDDTIRNTGNNVTINSRKDDNFITSSKGQHVTIQVTATTLSASKAATAKTARTFTSKSVITTTKFLLTATAV